VVLGFARLSGKGAEGVAMEGLGEGITGALPRIGAPVNPGTGAEVLLLEAASPAVGKVPSAACVKWGKRHTNTIIHKELQRTGHRFRSFIFVLF